MALPEAPPVIVVQATFSPAFTVGLVEGEPTEQMYSDWPLGQLCTVPTRFALTHTGGPYCEFP